MAARAEDNQTHANSVVSRKRGFDFDVVKLLAVTLLLAGGVYANWYFRDQSVLYRALAFIVLAGICVAIAGQTTVGHSVWSLIKEARVEIRRVVFPTRTETTNSTMVVVAFIIVVALVLWVLDLMFGAIISRLIG